MKLTTAALLTFAAGAAGAVAAQKAPPTPTPAPVEQHVVAPSLPDEPNKEGKVRPGGGIPTDEYGNILAGPGGVVDPSAAKPTPGAGGTSKGAPASGAAPLPAVPTPPPGPSGPTDVRAAYLTLRGTVKAYEKGVSVSIVEKNGVERTVKLAANASVYDGLAAGDKVVLRIPLKRPADGKSTDRVSRQTPAKAPPKSKFTQAQSPAS
jgi:hypothetical protein